MADRKVARPGVTYHTGEIQITRDIPVQLDETKEPYLHVLNRWIKQFIVHVRENGGIAPESVKGQIMLIIGLAAVVTAVCLGVWLLGFPF